MRQERPAGKPTLHLQLDLWMRMCRAYGLDTCAARARVLHMDGRYLRRIEKPTRDNVSEREVGGGFVAAVLAYMPPPFARQLPFLLIARSESEAAA